MNGKIIELKGKTTFTTEAGKEMDVSITIKSTGEMKSENGKTWLRVVPEDSSMETVELDFYVNKERL